MNTQAIRDYVEGTTSIRNLALAVLEIAAALDALDERMRPGGTPEPGPASTIPGCFCRECKWAQPLHNGQYWTCGLLGSPAYAGVPVPVDFGCTMGERREAE